MNAKTPMDHDVITNTVTESEDDIRAHWTDEAMAEAIPLEMPEGGPPAPPETWEQIGQLTAMESVAPDGEYLAYGEDDLRETAAQAGTFVTTKVPTSNFTKFPWQAVGKLYMVFGGKNFVGTAWALSGSESGIFTAGHCVYDTEHNFKWASKVLFKGRYNNGSAAGTWTMSTLGTLVGWTKKSGSQYDLGCCLATSKIRPTLGALGWMANYPPNQGPYTAIGYPVTPVTGYAFNGQEMWQSVGPYINGSSILQMYNNMTGGCSGGPWSVTKGGVPYANGLNSFRYTSVPSTMYSPYFGQGFLNLVDVIKGK